MNFFEMRKPHKLYRTFYLNQILPLAQIFLINILYLKGKVLLMDHIIKFSPAKSGKD